MSLLIVCKMSARNVATAIFVLEIVWLIYYAVSLFMVEILTETVVGETYRITIAIAAFHTVGLVPSILFTLSDCSSWVLICFFAVVLTDTLNLLRVCLHISSTDYNWSRIMLFVLTSFALSTSAFALGWRIYVRCKGICFTSDERPRKMSRRLV